MGDVASYLDAFDVVGLRKSLIYGNITEEQIRILREYLHGGSDLSASCSHLETYNLLRRFNLVRDMEIGDKPRAFLTPSGEALFRDEEVYSRLNYEPTRI